MKTKVWICGVSLALVAGLGLGALIATSVWNRRSQKRMMGEALDEVFYSYAPLKLLSAMKTEKAQALLLSRLGEALEHCDAQAKFLPGFAGTNMAMIKNAKALHEKLTVSGNIEPTAPVDGGISPLIHPERAQPAATEP